MNYKVTAEEGLREMLHQGEYPFAVMMKHGTMTIEYFAPQEVDEQTPHKQDEIYVIIKGHGTLYRDGKRISCKKNDVLFVPAGMEHYFENFSDDFATWVIFYGPEGGEDEDVEGQ
ncbi:MAG TPA: cupin domain-containing protein [Chitinophagaceae bacterium]|nr:cupin domain-containing protein [Chitinophagaceae bacterium]